MSRIYSSLSKFLLWNTLLFAGLIMACSGSKDKKATPRFTPDGIPIMDVAALVGSEVDTMKLRDIVDSIWFIALETPKEALINFENLEKIVLEKDKILVATGIGPSGQKPHCYLFDSSGKFLREISRFGQGPHDHLGIRDVYVIPNTDIITFENSRKIYFFRMDGSFIKAYKKDDYTIIGPPLNDSMFVAAPFYDGVVPYKGSLMQIKKDSIVPKIKYPDYGMNMEAIKDEKSIFRYIEHAIYPFEGNVHLYTKYNDTIFTIKQDGTIWSAFIFDFGQYKVPSVPILPDFTPLSEDKGNYIHATQIVESKDYLFVRLNMGKYAPDIHDTEHEIETTTEDPVTHKSVPVKYTAKNRITIGYCLYNKRSGELNLFSHNQLLYDLSKDGRVWYSFWPRYISSTGEMIHVVEPAFLSMLMAQINDNNLRPELLPLKGKLKEDDNPIIMIAKLK